MHTVYRHALDCEEPDIDIVEELKEGIRKKCTNSLYAKGGNGDVLQGCRTCNAELVIMLALNEAHAHLEMLQKVVALLQNQDLVAEIVSSDNAAEAYSLVKDQLL